MQILRTVIWIAVTAILVAFIAMNWDRAPVNLWPLDGGNYIHFQWPVGVIALIFFLLGFVPMWLVHRAGAWRLHRRIGSLENSLRLAAAPPAASTTAVSTAPESAATPSADAATPSTDEIIPDPHDPKETKPGDAAAP